MNTIINLISKVWNSLKEYKTLTRRTYLRQKEILLLLKSAEKRQLCQCRDHLERLERLEKEVAEMRKNVS
jgi:hypothetical protein